MLVDDASMQLPISKHKMSNILPTCQLENHLESGEERKNLFAFSECGFSFMYRNKKH